MELFGYVDRLSARPGEEIAGYISLQREGNVDVDVVRLIHGDENPSGPGFKTGPVPAIAQQSIRASAQWTTSGSCMVAVDVWADAPDCLTVELLVWPTLPARGHRQGLLSIVGGDGTVVALALSDDGTPELLAGRDDELVPRGIAHRPLAPRAWVSVRATIDKRSQRTVLLCEPVEGSGRDEVAVDGPLSIPSQSICVVGALGCSRIDGRYVPSHCFNGKIEHPKLAAGTDGSSLADWRFEQEMESSRAVDVSGRNRHGHLVNMPARAMTGHTWAGNELSHVHAPDQYAAIHFHEDDLEDAGWDESVRLRLPADLPSGVYAMRLRSEEEVDHVPFAVSPGSGEPRASVTLLLPTFTYVAYANERLLEREPHSIVIGPHDRAIAEHSELSLSLYDRHRDGSGVCYASSLRPLLNIRPDYRSWVHDAPRHLSADLYIVDWLEHLDVPYDVVTDHDLHRDGVAALGDSEVVITGGHPEYCSAQMLDGLEAHLARGGRMMYLGGNGFYWVTSQHAERSHVVEVRRGFAGTRTWDSEPGETFHSTTGEPGGLWRHRGRPPNALVGVGFAAQLTGARTAQARSRLKAPGYRRLPDSFLPDAAFAFDGIDADEVIGDFGLIMDGASGDEIDRYDVERGSPVDALLVARSTGHSDLYLLCSEDVPMISATLAGPTNELVHSDMTLLRLPGGGAVFSVGSICFAGSLSHNGYANNVARLVTNVLNEFTRRPRAQPGEIAAI